jgi:hypothetical protein
MSDDKGMARLGAASASRNRHPHSSSGLGTARNEEKAWGISTSILNNSTSPSSLLVSIVSSLDHHLRICALYHLCLKRRSGVSII